MAYIAWSIPMRIAATAYLIGNVTILYFIFVTRDSFKDHRRHQHLSALDPCNMEIYTSDCITNLKSIKPVLSFFFIFLRARDYLSLWRNALYGTNYFY